MKRLICSFGTVLLLSGCATAKFSQVGGRTIADITNTGWYLCNVIPIASGDPEHPNQPGCRLFEQTVTLDNNLRLLDYAMRDYINNPTELANMRYGEVVSYMQDESVLFILFKRRACHTSAELIRNGNPQ